MIKDNLQSPSQLFLESTTSEWVRDAPSGLSGPRALEHCALLARAPAAQKVWHPPKTVRQGREEDQVQRRERAKAAPPWLAKDLSRGCPELTPKPRTS